VPGFDLLPIEEIPLGKETFWKLAINGRCGLDDFVEMVNRAGNLRKDFEKIQTILILKATGQPVSPAKFKLLKRTKKDPYPDYEIKSGDLRLYLFEDREAGKIIVLGGKKKDQQADIEDLRRKKLAYFKAKED
jgi:hypothetical protein